MGISKKIASAAALCATSAKSVIKLAIESRPCGIRKAEDSDESLIIMGNGPSLADAMANHAPALRNHPLMAVNFAANAEEFYGFATTCWPIRFSLPTPPTRMSRSYGKTFPSASTGQ